MDGETGQENAGSGNAIMNQILLGIWGGDKVDNIFAIDGPESVDVNIGSIEEDGVVGEDGRGDVSGMRVLGCCLRRPLIRRAMSWLVAKSSQWTGLRRTGPIRSWRVMKFQVGKRRGWVVTKL